MNIFDILFFDYLFNLILGATVESLLEELDKNNNIIQIWDEFSTLIGSFGLYKGGGAGGSVYDRSIFLTLYNGEVELQHATKKYKLNLEHPRLSIFAAGHPHKIIEMLEKEKNMTNCDGLISRFIICAPKAVRIELKDLINVPTGSLLIEQLLCGIYLQNKIAASNLTKDKVTELLSFENEAFILLNDQFREYERISSKFELKETCYIR